MKNPINRALRRLARKLQPSPKTLAIIEAEVMADLPIECIEVPAMTVEQIILNMRKDGLSYRQIQAETGASYHKVRKVCLSA